jgi:hypothetical protein
MFLANHLKAFSRAGILEKVWVDPNFLNNFISFSIFFIPNPNFLSLPLPFEISKILLPSISHSNMTFILKLSQMP